MREPTHVFVVHSSVHSQRMFFVFSVHLCGGRDRERADRQRSDEARHFIVQPSHQQGWILGAGQKERKESGAAGEGQTHTALEAIKMLLVLLKSIICAHARIQSNNMYVLESAWELNNS